MIRQQNAQQARTRPPAAPSARAYARTCGAAGLICPGTRGFGRVRGLAGACPGPQCPAPRRATTGSARLPGGPARTRSAGRSRGACRTRPHRRPAPAAAPPAHGAGRRVFKPGQQRDRCQLPRVQVAAGVSDERRDWAQHSANTREAVWCLITQAQSKGLLATCRGAWAGEAHIA